MHRDIKPGNLALVTSTPPRAIIIDFGCATWDLSSTDHSIGTIPYLAPEVVALKRNKSRDPYDKAVDIWGLGVSAFQLLCRRHRMWAEINLQAFNGLQARLRGASRDLPSLKPVLDVVHRMTTWDSDARISATEALAADIFQSIGD